MGLEDQVGGWRADRVEAQQRRAQEREIATAIDCAAFSLERGDDAMIGEAQERVVELIDADTPAFVWVLRTAAETPGERAVPLAELIARTGEHLVDATRDIGATEEDGAVTLVVHSVVEAARVVLANAPAPDRPAVEERGQRLEAHLMRAVLRTGDIGVLAPDYDQALDAFARQFSRASKRDRVRAESVLVAEALMHARFGSLEVGLQLIARVVGDDERARSLSHRLVEDLYRDNQTGDDAYALVIEYAQAAKAG